MIARQGLAAAAVAAAVAAAAAAVLHGYRVTLRKISRGPLCYYSVLRSRVASQDERLLAPREQFYQNWACLRHRFGKGIMHLLRVGFSTVFYRIYPDRLPHVSPCCTTLTSGKRPPVLPPFLFVQHLPFGNLPFLLKGVAYPDKV